MEWSNVFKTPFLYKWTTNAWAMRCLGLWSRDKSIWSRTSYCSTRAPKERIHKYIFMTLFETFVVLKLHYSPASWQVFMLRCFNQNRKRRLRTPFDFNCKSFCLGELTLWCYECIYMYSVYTKYKLSVQNFTSIKDRPLVLLGTFQRNFCAIFAYSCVFSFNHATQWGSVIVFINGIIKCVM